MYIYIYIFTKKIHTILNYTFVIIPRCRSYNLVSYQLLEFLNSIDKGMVLHSLKLKSQMLKKALGEILYNKFSADYWKFIFYN